MERDQATKFINDLLKLMVSRNGSDLFITGDFPPAIKVDGKVTKVSPQPLNAAHTMALARSMATSSISLAIGCKVRSDCRCGAIASNSACRVSANTSTATPLATSPALSCRCASCREPSWSG